MAPISAAGSCAACEAPANKTCQGCVDGLDAMGQLAARILYCSVGCQKNDWASHKALCKQLKVRKELYRICDFIQSLFYAFRQHSFELPLRKIEKQGTEIHIWPSHGKSDISDQWKGALRDTDIKKAVLGWYVGLYTGESSDACLFLCTYLKELQGLSKDIGAARVIMKRSCPLTVHYHFHPKQEQGQAVTPTNTVLKVTLKHGAGTFAVGLSGAQFGFFDTVVPWDVYLSERADVVKSYVPSQTDTGGLGAIGLNLWLPTNEALNKQKDEMMPFLLQISLGKAWKREKVTIITLPQLPEKVFQPKKRAVIQHVNAMLGGYIEGCRQDIARHNKAEHIPAELKGRHVYFSRISEILTEGQQKGDQSMKHAIDEYLGKVGFEGSGEGKKAARFGIF